MLGQRLRRCPSIEPVMGQCFGAARVRITWAVTASSASCMM